MRIAAADALRPTHAYGMANGASKDRTLSVSKGKPVEGRGAGCRTHALPLLAGPEHPREDGVDVAGVVGEVEKPF